MFLVTRPDPKSDNLTTWNSELARMATTFASSLPDATVMIFSSWDTFNRVLDNPADYGFNEDHVGKEGGQIWVDHLHPTSEMHAVIARDLVAFLESQARWVCVPACH
jgi:phospholipase/lecithinase/hemolysin